ncbi:MAG: class I SAM-dependent methyltransferase [Anaerolineales bacterium]|nr:class I SAM-dependent methyltransferase [Anaerolineales bacterium]
MQNFDYESIWKGVWGGMQKYGPVHRHHRRIFSELFKSIQRDEIKTIADIGCGEGSNLLYLKVKFPGAELYGFDVSNTAIQTAKSNIDANFSILDIQDEIPSQKFDLVFCSDVVEHLENDEAAISNMRRITNKYALIATVQGTMRRNEKSIGHVRNYAYGELQQKVEFAEFDILQVVEWGYPLYSPIFRNIISFFPNAEAYSYGEYNILKKFISHILYYIFFLNRSDKGDIIFILAKARER